MKKNEWADGKIRILKKDYPVKVGEMKQTDLKFYNENPRVYSLVRADESEPSQRVIQKRLVGLEHTRQLVQSIKANGGLTDALIVRDGDFVVLEGNSRLAAYRALAKTDPIKWGMVPVRLLQKDIDENVVFALLGQYHIIGRQDWKPFEQAGYLWRRYTKHEIEPEKMAKEMGISKKAVQHLIQVYSFMVKHKDKDLDRWSYYYEYLRSHDIEHARQQYPELDKVVVKQIKKNEITKAADIRDKLKKVCKAGGKVLKRYVQGIDILEHSYEIAVSKGVNNAWLNRLKKWRKIILDPEAKKQIKNMQKKHKGEILYEMKKINRRLADLIKMLNI